MNITIIMTAIAGAATIAWPFCHTIPNIIGISILYGYDMLFLFPNKNEFMRADRFSSGAWLALIGSTVGQMGGIEDLGRRLGAINTIAGIGTLCGPPVSGLFADSRLGYIAVGYFAGEDIV